MQDNPNKLDKQYESQAISKACSCGERPLILCEQEQRCSVANFLMK